MLFISYIDKSGLKQMDPFKLTFYLSLVVSICVFIYGISTQTLAFSLTPGAWFLTLMIALLVIRLIGSTKASILCLAEPITSVVCGVVLLNEQLSIMKLIGCAFILLSSYSITKDK